MPRRRLIREPHLLAHELRTPLGVLAGWCSLLADGDVDPDRTPPQWEIAMKACQDAVARLNVIISEACNEAAALQRGQPDQYAHFSELVEITTAAVGQSRRIREQIHRERRLTTGRSRPRP
jgi:signal transduction histidine kinase